MIVLINKFCYYYCISKVAVVAHVCYYVSLFPYNILGRGGSAGGKFRIALGLPVGAVMNCADNSGKYKNNNVLLLIIV